MPVARRRLATLLGRLLLDGFRDDALPTVRALPALSDALPDLSSDERAVRREALWGRWVSPHASAFLGGSARERVAAAYDGWDLGRSDVEPDHVGVQALFFALSGTFVTPEVLPLALRAVEASGYTEWTEVLALLTALVGPAPWVCDGAPLDDVDAGWRRLARRWVDPRCMGGWLTPADLDAVADGAGVPRGFGTRRSRAEKIALAAVDQGRAPALLRALGARVADWPGDAASTLLRMATAAESVSDD